MLTPGLTPTQAQQLHAYLLRLVGLRPSDAVALYQDADRIAGRILSPYGSLEVPRTREILEALRETHEHEHALIAYVAGLAFGIRLGRSFAPPPVRRSKWISAEYKRLTEPNRRQVARLIRLLLKAQEPPPPRPGSPSADLEAARRWTREAGRRARAQGVSR